MRNWILTAGVVFLCLQGPAMRAGEAENPDAKSNDVLLERFRARFSAGVILAKEAKDFSRTDPYLALDTDALFVDRPNQIVSGLLNVRLTSIPVASQDVKTPTADFSSFLKSQKAAIFQVGTFYGYSPKSAEWGGLNESYRFFAGPVVKFGMQSVTDSQKAVRIWNPTDDLYDSVTAGGRIALMDGKKDYIAYLDVSWGKFQNFEHVELGKTDLAKEYSKNPTDTNKAKLTKADFLVTKPGRLAIEGRLRFPPLKAVYVGVDINNGSGRDDMRFLGGVTFDLLGAIQKVMK